MKGYCISIESLALTLMLGIPAGVSAQASGQASGDIELGANQASEIEMSAGSSGSANANADSDQASRPSLRSGGDSDTRIGIQLRLDAVNTLRFAEPDQIGASLGQRLLVPIVTPGVRLLDEGALFIGLGFGFASYDGPMGGTDEFSRSGFSITPLGTYDLLRDDAAALSLLAAINLGSLGETESCDNTNAGQSCIQGDNDEFGFGIDLGVGVRGIIVEGLALGAEFGWGFLSRSADPDNDTFEHAVFGNLLLEASVGI
jgi:hypothetical protein